MARTHVEPNPAGLTRIWLRVQRVHDSVVEDVFADAWRGAAVATSEMRMSIHIRHMAGRIYRWSRSFVSRVVVGTDHWMFVEYSTSAHDIRPKDPNGALFWPGAPHPITVVHHPGTEEQPFMRPALYKRRSLRGRAI